MKQGVSPEDGEQRKEELCMDQLKVGFARVNATPMMGIGMRGYFRTRLAEGVLDELEISALALEAGGVKALLISMDICAIPRDCALAFKAHIAETVSIPEDAIYIHATHTHTGPYLRKETDDVLEQEYFRFVWRRMADVARFALDDMKPARMGWGVGLAPVIAFIRRYRMKDGSTQTNPGVNNPEIDGPIGEPDLRVNVLRFDRECGDHLVLVNFGNHPDVIGGCRISADWPGHLRREVERAIPDSKCIFFNGAQGDVNHINVHPVPDEEEILSESGKWGGYEHSRYMGRALAGTVLQVYDKVRAVEVPSIRVRQRTIRVPANVPAPERMPEAHRINELYKAGRASELPYKGMMNVTVVAEAVRMVELEHGPEFFDMDISAVAIGSVVMIGIPGEAFTGIGKALKESEGWDLIIPTCLTNGAHGYFPMQEAYDEGGYEARSSRFRPGVAELLIAEGKRLMDELR